MTAEKPRTLGELKASGYKQTSVRDEMRRNLIRKMRAGEPIFDGIIGYEETVIPQIENAVLSGQDIIFLGERGQAKSRMIRSLVNLLDDEIPIVAGSEINDDPFDPISRMALDLVESKGDDAPIEWVGRERRYGEKLATPDITIADLIGEVDPIKVAEGRYLSDELTIHYGLIPRTNRGIFCLNELPDLAERIQVGLLNIMEERDVQIRGYRVRLPLDVFVVASANPEDYTNRGRIITPLKDRYGTQIRTHYPKAVEHEIEIMEAERTKFADDDFTVTVPAYMKVAAYYLTYNVCQAPGGFVDLAMWLFRLAGITIPTDEVGFVNGAFANVVAYGVGMMNSFILNKTWTFKIREDTARQMFRFTVINCAALALSTVAIFLLVDVGGWPYVITWFAVIAPVTVLSFAANKFWAFSATRR